MKKTVNAWRYFTHFIKITPKGKTNSNELLLTAKTVCVIHTFVSAVGSGYVSTVTAWFSRAGWVKSWSSSNVGSISTMTRLGPGGRALVSDVLGLCSITATHSSSSKALCKKPKHSERSALRSCLIFSVLCCVASTCFHRCVLQPDDQRALLGRLGSSGLLRRLHL